VTVSTVAVEVDATPSVVLVTVPLAPVSTVWTAVPAGPVTPPPPWLVPPVSDPLASGPWGALGGVAAGDPCGWALGGVAVGDPCGGALGGVAAGDPCAAALGGVAAGDPCAAALGGVAVGDPCGGAPGGVAVGDPCGGAPGGVGAGDAGGPHDCASASAVPTVAKPTRAAAKIPAMTATRSERATSVRQTSTDLPIRDQLSSQPAPKTAHGAPEVASKPRILGRRLPSAR
jgi:hypothetical protein